MQMNFKIKSLFKIIPVLFILMSFAFPASVLAQTLYAKSSNTKLQKSESATSPVLGKLRKGAAVSVVKKGKKFYQVKAGSKTGWVFKFKLTSKRPASTGGSGLSGLGGDRVASSGSGSGSSIRGLSPISEDYAKRKGITAADIAAVDHMEHQKISERELDSFLQAGKLREYGE